MLASLAARLASLAVAMRGYPSPFGLDPRMDGLILLTDILESKEILDAHSDCTHVSRRKALGDTLETIVRNRVISAIQPLASHGRERGCHARLVNFVGESRPNNHGPSSATGTETQALSLIRLKHLGHRRSPSIIIIALNPKLREIHLRSVSDTSNIR